MIVGSCLLAPVAHADKAWFEDGDERPFCEQPTPAHGENDENDCPDTDYMDIRRVTHGHGSEHGRLQHGIRTAERWSSKELGGRHGVTVYFEFDLDRNANADRAIRIRRKDGQMQAHMFEGRYLNRRVGGPLKVWRPNKRAIKVEFDVSDLGDGLTEYRWRAGWDLRAICPGSCPSEGAPDRGWYAHLL